MNGAELLVRALRAEGVTQIYGIPGTTIMDFLDALAGQDGVDGQDGLAGQDRIRYLSVRHEQGAAFMADGFSRASGEVGVCLGSRGPGLTNMATAIANARDESVPLLALVGQVADGIADRDAFEELNVTAMFGPVTKWCVEIRSAERIPELVQRALRTARSGRPGPVVVSVPLDVLTAELAGDVPLQPIVRVEPPRPAAHAVTRIAEILAASSRPVIIVGGGLRDGTGLGGGTGPGGGSEVAALAARYAAPAVTTWSRKDRFPNDDPHFLGVLGAGALEVTDRAVREADVLLALGCRFSEFTTKRWTLLDPSTRVLHVDIDPNELGKVYPPEVAVHADAAATVADLLARADPAPDAAATGAAPDGALADLAAARADLAAARADRLLALAADHREQSTLPVRAEKAMTTAQLAAGLGAVLARRQATLIVDAPSTGVWVSRYLRFAPPATRYRASAGGAMAWGFPAALGTALARPEERVICLSGDGSFVMVAAEIETAVREHIPVVVVVANNFAYGNTRDRQRFSHGERYFGVFYDNMDFAAFARLHGAHGERVEHPDDLEPAIERALDSGLPAVVDVIQDRFEGLPPGARPLPPR
jgi:acetolactate synthase I/II/III large subunit